MHKNFLKKYYFISNFEPNNIKNIDANTSIIYRNYNSSNNYPEIIKVKQYCDDKGIKFFLSNDLKLAIRLNCDGIYLPSFNNKILTKGIKLKQNFEILGSAHNLKEIRQKENQGVKTLFISSIFKKNKNFLGIYRFISLIKFTKCKIIALGGVSDKNIKFLNLVNLDGFAGISFFQKKTPSK
tara:strand:- start:2711 stop:3256 length:546 start_codon:yes stop_codon:yes gene_type:complete